MQGSISNSLKGIKKALQGINRAQAGYYLINGFLFHQGKRNAYSMELLLFLLTFIV